MKLRTIDEIIAGGKSVLETGDISTREALAVAYSAVEEMPSGIPNREKVLAKLRELLMNI